MFHISDSYSITLWQFTITPNLFKAGHSVAERYPKRVQSQQISNYPAKSFYLSCADLPDSKDAVAAHPLQANDATIIFGNHHRCRTWTPRRAACAVSGWNAAAVGRPIAFKNAGCKACSSGVLSRVLDVDK